MENIIRKSSKFLVALFGLTMVLASCEYETEVRHATYPEQLIYMPAAYGGIYFINDISRKRGDHPVEGEPFKYVIDTIGRKFNVPLSVYRSGINNEGAFKVDIAVNTDTINKLLLIPGKLPAGTILLGSDKYSIINSVDVTDGAEIASFDLIVNLDSLLKNYPNKIYALGVGIASTQRKSNPNLSTTIVVIDTKIMKPTANFTYSVDGTNPKKIIFTNTSLMSDNNSSWNFGDGSAPSTVVSPSYTYAAAGTYTVTLIAKGITGNQNKSTKTAVITIL
jgi:PKD repeat protein